MAQPISHEEIFSNRKKIVILPKEKKEAMEGQNRRISEIGFLSNRRFGGGNRVYWAKIVCYNRSGTGEKFT